MHKADLTVLANEPIARHIYRIVLRGETAHHVQRPGQFVHIRCGDGWDMPLRRPLSLASWDESRETVSLIYRTGGKGTNWLAKRKTGESIDVLGPLGNGFPVPAGAGKKVLLVGGGVGVPPLYGLAEELLRHDADICTCLGFASQADVFLEEDFRRLGDVRVATEDGSYGDKGLVTDLLQEPLSWDVVYACGPLPLLRAVKQRLAGTGIEGYVSLEARMGCGVGACLACVCETPEANRVVKICCDGPVFHYQEVAL